MQMLAALTERCAVPRGPLTLRSPGPGRLGVGSREVAETAVTCTVGMLTLPGVKGKDTVKSLSCPNATPGLEVHLIS